MPRLTYRETWPEAELQEAMIDVALLALWGLRFSSWHRIAGSGAWAIYFAQGCSSNFDRIPSQRTKRKVTRSVGACPAWETKEYA